jgi:hypothetical protein
MSRRLTYFYRYLLAKARSKQIEKLLPIIEKSFEHPWVASVELTVEFWPSNRSRWARLWPWYEHSAGPQTQWDAPVTVAVFRRRRGKKKMALCMSLYVARRTLYIAQLQGILGTDPPKELRAWAKMFIESCRAFARQTGLRAIKVARAETLYSYRNPYLNPLLLPESRDNALKRIRRSMQLLYDANALELGFVPDGDWLKWESSESTP